jgi:hypothetical protein
MLAVGAQVCLVFSLLVGKKRRVELTWRQVMNDFSQTDDANFLTEKLEQAARMKAVFSWARHQEFFSSVHRQPRVRDHKLSGPPICEFTFILRLTSFDFCFGEQA